MTQTIWHLGDELEPITETIRDSNGDVVSLVSATAQFKARKVGVSATTISDNATVLSPKANGNVEYTWGQPITAAGQYLVWWVITDGSNSREVGERLIEFRDHAPAGYVELEQLKKTLSLTSTSFADQDITLAIRAASRCCDGYKSDRFYATDETRYYTGRLYDSSIDIDSLNDLTSLNVDTSGVGAYETAWTEGTEFYLDPVNNATAGFPYTRVTLRRQRGARFPGYDNGVRIVGSFGWAATPPNVVQATTILAGRLLKRARETPYGILTVTGDAVAAARLGRIDPDVAFLLDNLPGSVPLLAV